MSVRCNAILTSTIMGMLAASAPGLESPPALESRIAYGDGISLAEIPSDPIKESSGLARGRNGGDVFWTHNDSGAGPILYAFNAAGDLRAEVTLTGVRNQDWEDMSSFSHDGSNYLMVGAVGDNDNKRENYSIHILLEPTISSEGAKAIASVPVLSTINFMYEDGPHNCESIAMDPAGRTIYLATKHTKESGITPAIYALDWPMLSTTDQVIARRTATLDIPSQATAMDIAQDGRRAVVLTYQDAYEFVRRRDETWAEAFRGSPREIVMPRRLQGESICYGVGNDDKTLYLTSECRTTTSQPLYMVPVLGRVAYDPTNGTETVVSTIPPDYIDPAVTITAPTLAATVRGASTVSYTATDDQDVVAVTLLVDGVVALATNDLVGALAWDSRTVANGERALTLVVRDADGNEGTAQVRVVVDNAPVPVDPPGPIDGGGVIDTPPPAATDGAKKDTPGEGSGGCGSGASLAALLAAVALCRRLPREASPHGAGRSSITP